MKNKEIEKLELLVSFVNNIAELVCSPDEYQSPNCKNSCCLSIGYSMDDNEEPVIETIECEDDTESLEDTLDSIYAEVKSYLKVDFSKEWAKLQE